MIGLEEKEKLFKPYYTKSNPIVSYMIRKLSVESGVSVFEPCAGDGVFIDALINRVSGLTIDAYELNPSAVEILREKYKGRSGINITLGDTLTSEEWALLSNAGGAYDRIIANPPYGAWQDYTKRKLLKKLYLGLYVKETYALFLYRCIQLLCERGILVFIVPDTFLNLHMHTKLRETILTRTKIREILLFPPTFFPDVNFGYSKLSIISLEKCGSRERCLDNRFRIITGFKNVDELTEVEEDGVPKKHLGFYNYTQRDVCKNLNHAFFVTEEPRIVHLINNGTKRIGPDFRSKKPFLSRLSTERGAKKWKT